MAFIRFIDYLKLSEILYDGGDDRNFIHLRYLLLTHLPTDACVHAALWQKHSHPSRTL